MDPISLAIGAVGLGLQIFGGMKQSKDSEQAAKISKDEAVQEQGINQQKQLQMQVEARRMQLETVRNEQRARAMATNAAVTQGASFGSGLMGGLAQIGDQAKVHEQGVSNAEEIGTNIFGLNNNISADKMQMADVQSQSAKDAQWSSVGGALMKSGPIIGQISKGFGGLNFGQSLFGGGSPSGYGVG